MLPAQPGIAWAQAYPSRPVTLIVPFAAGGPTDTIARIMAERMRQSLGQPVIIENVPAPRAASASAGSPAPRPMATRSASATGHACRQRRHLCAALRPAQRFRAGRARLPPIRMIVGKKGVPANDLQGSDRLAEGQPGQGIRRDSRHRHAGPCRGHVLPEAHRHALPVRALSRRRPGDAGPAGRADRPDVRPGAIAAAGPRRQLKAYAVMRARSACRPRPIFQR